MPEIEEEEEEDEGFLTRISVKLLSVGGGDFSIGSAIFRAWMRWRMGSTPSIFSETVVISSAGDCWSPPCCCLESRRDSEAPI